MLKDKLARSEKHSQYSPKQNENSDLNKFGLCPGRIMKKIEELVYVDNVP